MRRAVLFVAACVLSLGLAGTASAAPSGHHGHHGHHGGRAYYYHSHGVRFSGGYYYPGFNHHHWSRRVWDVRCERWNYYDPYLQTWYYWVPSAGAYYPVTYVVP
jgi:hypothetical protein